MTLKYKLSRKKEDKENPLNVVLMQEIQRYNILLGVITKSLEQLEKGVKGFVLISPELEAMLNSIN
jgi:dynein heavy chain